MIFCSSLKSVPVNTVLASLSKSARERENQEGYSQEETLISREFESRRTRIGAPSRDLVMKEVEREVLGPSKVLSSLVLCIFMLTVHLAASKALR